MFCRRTVIVWIGILSLSSMFLLGQDTWSLSCPDADGDGYGDPASGLCPHPERDCHDGDPAVNPGATEGPYGDPTCSDALDNNCDGRADGDDAECEEIQVPVTIDPAEEAGRLDDRYLGFAFDMVQFTEGFWWDWGPGGPQPEPTPDLESPKLRRLASYLAPSRMRVGGTDSDAAYFCPEEGECELPPSYQNVYPDPDEERPGVVSREDIRRIADFAEAVGARIMFCLNVGPGPRDPATGRWTPDNARDLIRYARSLPNGDLFDVWEPGNEVNLIWYTFNMPALLTPDLFASDLAAFRALVDEEAPGSLVACPGSFFVPYRALNDLGFTRRVLSLARDKVDIVTWHLYATQSERCPAIFSPARASRETLFDPSNLAMNRYFARYVAQEAAGLPVWNGESASSQCGGQPGVSDTLLDALWLADWIGVMAEEGSSTLVRQTLVGGDYGMIDPDTLDPRPSLLAYVMHRRTVEGTRLLTEADRSLVKAHGYCSAGMDGSVTAVLSNPSGRMVTAEVSLAGMAVSSARQWTVGAGGDLTATRATIEGLTHEPDGTIPDPPGTPVPVNGGKAYARVGPNSLVFVDLEPVEAGPVCRAIPSEWN
jgi:heparanase 1